ncbi:Tether containing UBX domain for GLUT4 [Entomortierella chlamydospora]|uniref:Tether containing UBX domain for GLUT4 n=1 Tax=Entomortierella chlamydospora TaxID=101097 RepID=A0A9P6N2E0_9FUNG|nr:Tether containing UBX domain for GLUT4 [Entomortierella chlamydospora]
MASNLTVFLGGGKKQLVKTIPTMILRQVVNIVCEKQNYAEPESYGLKSGKNFLDLSLSIRYANIAPGAKLELAKAPKDNFDLTCAMAVAERTLNLTRRTAVPQPTTKNIFSLQRIKKAVKPSTEVYLLPVVILLEHEYVSIPTLKTTSLQLAGLLKGNAVFRVMMRYTDAGIADFIEDIERDYSHPTKTNSESTHHSSSSTASPPHSASPHPSSASPTPTPASSVAASYMEHSSPSRQGSTAYPVKIPIRQPTMDKTMGEVDFIQAKEAFNQAEFGINPQGIEPPGMTGRSGGVEVESREGNMVTPAPGSGINIDIQRQTPVQDMSAAMIEHSQEIRQRQEQQTQAAMSDRVKKLSRASDDSDRERFVRSLPPGSYGEVTEEPSNMMDVDSKELVLQIAQLVSQKLKSAQQRGDSTVDYQTLIAEEIEKKQKAGVLPSTPSGSRHNSYYRSKVEDDASPMLIAPPSRASTLAPVEEKVVEEKVVEEKMVEEKVDREVKVFRAPADSSAPLSNQIDLPDDFYELSSQDVMKLMNSQKAKREQEENRGFKTAAARAEEEKAREKRYPKTIIRIRFPDRVQIQGTFRSQETIGDLRKWVASVCVGQGEKFDLYTTPPKKVLTDNKQTLYQAGLAPQSIVSFSWVDTKLNTNSPFLNGEYMMMIQDLPVPGQANVEESKPEEVPLSVSLPMRAETDSRTGSISMLTREDRRMSARMSTDKPGSSGGGLPKWMKLSKK